VSRPIEKDITRTVWGQFGKHEIVVGHQYENGDIWQWISVPFALDGHEWPSGAYLMRRKGDVYATAMSPEDWQADREMR
jgi:hypothetical protein